MLLQSTQQPLKSNTLHVHQLTSFIKGPGPSELWVRMQSMMVKWQLATARQRAGAVRNK